MSKKFNLWTGFTQAFSGATARTYLAKGRDTINLLDAGGSVDGTTDNAAALARALAALPNGGVINLPVGSLRLNSSFVIATSGITIRGAGRDATNILYYGTGKAIQITAAERVSLEDFRVTNSGSSGSVGVAFNYSAATTSFQHAARKIHIVSFTTAGFQNTNSEQFIGEDIKVFGCGIGFDLNNNDNSAVALGIANRYTECRAQSCTSDGWDVQYQQNSTFMNCEGLQNTAPNAQFRLRGTCRSCHIINLDVEKAAAATVGLQAGGDGHKLQILGFQLATGISLESAVGCVILPGVYTNVTTQIAINGASTGNVVLGLATVSENTAVSGQNTYLGPHMVKECLTAWVADDVQNPSLGTLPANTYVTGVALQVTEAFNSDGTDTISVGYDAAATAYIAATDVSTTGIKSPTAGALMGYNDTSRAVEAYYVNGGTEPSTGKAIVVLEFWRVPIQVS